MRVKFSLMEILWLVIALISVITFFVALERDGWDEAKTFLIFTAVAIAMFLLRRWMRSREKD